MANKPSQKRNIFLKNSFDILKGLSKKISDKAINSDEEVVDAILYFAIAIEKLLKGIIYDINPLYILMYPEFKNSVSVYYETRIKSNTELDKKANGDVIAFQSSILRAITFSKAVLEHKNTLMKIKDARDIIVHHHFGNLKINELKTLLYRDFYPLLNALSTEHNLGGQTNIFNSLNSKLALISSDLQSDTASKLKLKIESTRQYWNTLKGSSTFQIIKCDNKTIDLLLQQFYYPTKCPSCGHTAVVLTQPIFEFNPYLKEEIQVGLDLKKLECHYCKLVIDDYNALDTLKIKPNVDQKEEIIQQLKKNDDEHQASL